jgi:predicted dehydrogenase
MKTLLQQVDHPKAIVATINAGKLPADHWHLDPDQGGGRIIAEACHFIDLLRHLTGSPIDNIQTTPFAGGQEQASTITLTFSDGSTGTIHYLTNGHPRVSKERFEVYSAGRFLGMDNFRKLSTHGWPRARRPSLTQRDKGHRYALDSFIKATVNGYPPPIPPEELFEVSLASIQAARG